MTDLIVSDPDIRSGQWCFAGTRIPVRIALYAKTEGRDWVLRNYPAITDAMIDAALAWTWPAVQAPEVCAEHVTLTCACGEGYGSPTDPIEIGVHELECTICGRRWLVAIGVEEIAQPTTDATGDPHDMSRVHDPEYSLEREINTQLQQAAETPDDLLCSVVNVTYDTVGDLYCVWLRIWPVVPGGLMRDSAAQERVVVMAAEDAREFGALSGEMVVRLPAGLWWEAGDDPPWERQG